MICCGTQIKNSFKSWASQSVKWGYVLRLGTELWIYLPWVPICHVPFPITVIPPHPTIVLRLVRLRLTIVSRLRLAKPLFYEQVHFRSDIVSAQWFRRCGPTGHSLSVTIVASPPITPFQSYVSDPHHSTWPYAWSMLPFLWTPDQFHLHSYHCCSSYISESPILIRI